MMCTSPLKLRAGLVVMVICAIITCIIGTKQRLSIVESVGDRINGSKHGTMYSQTSINYDDVIISEGLSLLPQKRQTKV